MAQLVVIEGKNVGSVVTLSARNRVGSAADNEVIVPEPQVKPRHAVLSLDGGAYHIRAESGAALQINGREMREGDLHHGDIITLGGSLLLFSDEAPAAIPVPRRGIPVPGASDLTATVETRLRHFASADDALTAMKRS